MTVRGLTVFPAKAGTQSLTCTMQLSLRNLPELRLNAVMPIQIQQSSFQTCRPARGVNHNSNAIQSHSIFRLQPAHTPQPTSHVALIQPRDLKSFPTVWLRPRYLICRMPPTPRRGRPACLPWLLPIQPTPIPENSPPIRGLTPPVRPEPAEGPQTLPACPLAGPKAGLRDAPPSSFR